MAGQHTLAESKLKVTPWCTPTSHNQCPYQVSTSYTFQNSRAWTRSSKSRSLQQGQRSNQGHTMLLHAFTPNQCPYQVSTSYTLWFLRYSLDQFYRSRSLQGQRSNQGQTMTLHTYNPGPMSLQSINFLHLTISEIQPWQDFIGHGDYDIAYLQPPTNVPTKNQLPTPYSFRDIAQTRFYKSR